ncbi:hypothetical protein N0V90_010496 [Kalmusia sp. IMI 367209]|nr:hypothetical protein N0V90_010496 [Kalmusia sp. IMI 367209]
MEQYMYQPLPTSSSIRLLKFDPGNEDLRCSFVIVDTNNAPSYIALSYVWGDPANPLPIYIDGKVVRITQNLHSVLLHFRKTPALLWADALCINQQDIPEKNTQVNMMSSIYQHAATVAVWLGTDEYGDADDIFEDAKAFIDFTTLVMESEGQFGHFDEVSGDIYWQLPDKRSIVSKLPEAIVTPDEEEIARLTRFLRLPYWSRTWVLQEIGLAKEAVILWGGKAFQWEAFGLFAMFLHRHCKALFIKLDLIAELERLVNVYLTFSPFRPMSTFLHVLHNVRRFNATDPRDKVFALLSHPAARTISPTITSLGWHGYRPAAPMACFLTADDRERYLIQVQFERRTEASESSRPLLPPLIQADYEKPKDEIYFELAMDHIQRHESLEILSTVQHNPNASDELFCPSWVPQWDYYVDAPIFGFYSSQSMASANKRPITTRSSPGEKTLTLRGALLTRITLHTEVLKPSSFNLPLPTTPTTADSPEVQSFWAENPIANLWLKGFRHLDPESYPVLTGEKFALYNQGASNVYSAYMSTWVAGMKVGQVTGNFALSIHTKAYWDRLFYGSEGDSSTSFPRITIEKDVHMDNPVLNSQLAWQQYRDAAMDVCNNRKFFYTKKGFFGIGPGALREGDFVGVLLGGDVPFILREVLDDEEMSWEERKHLNLPVPMDRKFQLVGECWVRGLMEGQAVGAMDFQRNITLV